MLFVKAGLIEIRRYNEKGTPEAAELYALTHACARQTSVNQSLRVCRISVQTLLHTKIGQEIEQELCDVESIYIVCVKSSAIAVESAKGDQPFSRVCILLSELKMTSP